MNPLPPLIMIMLCALSLGVALARHGQPNRNYNFWASLLAVVFELLLLAWGGFFAPLFR